MKSGLNPMSGAAGVLIAVPLIIVVAICGGRDSSAAPVGVAGSQELQARTVSAACAALVSAAGAMYAPAPVIAAQMEHGSS